jgi:MATE family multidrug resistance protein
MAPPSSLAGAVPRSAWRDVVATAQLAVPLMLTNIAPNAFAVTNLTLVGQIGAVELAGAALSIGMVTLAMSVLGGLDAAAMALISSAIGGRRSNVRAIRRVLDHGFLSMLLCSLAVWPILWNVHAIALMFGQEAAVADAAQSVMRPLMWSLLPYLAFRLIRAFVGSTGRNASTLMVVALGVAANAGVGWLLIPGRYGLPALGLSGVGAATFCGSIVLLAGMYGVVRADRRTRRIAWSKRSWRFDTQGFGAFWQMSVPIGLTIFFEAGIFYAALLAVGRFGVEQLAAHSIAMQVVSLAFKVPIGLGQAATIRIARARGAGDAEGAAHAGWTALGMALVFAVGTAAMLVSIPATIARIFLGSDAAASAGVIFYATQFLFYAGLFQIADAAQGVLAGMLRGMHDTRIPMLLAALGYWGLGLPAGLILGFGFRLQGKGVWMGLALGLGVVAVLMGMRWANLARRLRAAADREAAIVRRFGDGTSVAPAEAN